MSIQSEDDTYRAAVGDYRVNLGFIKPDPLLPDRRPIRLYVIALQLKRMHNMSNKVIAQHLSELTQFAIGAFQVGIMLEIQKPNITLVIKELLQMGTEKSETARLLNVTPAAISYHLKKIETGKYNKAYAPETIDSFYKNVAFDYFQN